ncbi:hypothetical protein CDAR_410741 [Caerostris darwini]|uniref:Uncharacterized protein n=1 Tax=Caerostris darwini TaxID=1538125 RepID=A0AAV4P273_9ARAC|nr:hypothetical protein CDAR_410741 [Caerostris darwini]
MNEPLCMEGGGVRGGRNEAERGDGAEDLEKQEETTRSPEQLPNESLGNGRMADSKRYNHKGVRDQRKDTMHRRE